MPDLADGWQVAALGNLCRIDIGGTPSRDVSHFWAADGDDGEPWVAISDMAQRNVFNTSERISQAGIANSNVKRVAAGTVLMSFKLTLGKMAVAGRDLYTNEAIAAFLPGADIDSTYLYYALPDAVRRTATDVAIKGATLNKASLAAIPIAYPGRLEQQRIAAILTSLDNAIEATEALIEKHQQIKAGLMHDLFSRGLLPTGALRPSIDEAPTLYAESELGSIPQDWQVTTCEAVCERVIDCKNRTPPEVPDGYPVIRTPNVRGGEFIDDELVFTDARSYETWTARGKPVAGDIVITREAPVGEVCMIPTRHAAACLGQRMMLYRPDVGRIDPVFFLFALQSKAIQSRLDLIAGGSTVGHVRVGDIRSLWMYLPRSMAEQRQIAAALSAATSRIQSESEALAKLRMQKQGLMQDLLTGKVRVTAPADATA